MNMNHEDMLAIVQYVLNINTRSNGVIYDVSTNYSEKEVMVIVQNAYTGYERYVYVKNSDKEGMKKEIAKARKMVLTNGRG